MPKHNFHVLYTGPKPVYGIGQYGYGEYKKGDFINSFQAYSEMEAKKRCQSALLKVIGKWVELDNFNAVKGEIVC